MAQVGKEVIDRLPPGEPADEDEVPGELEALEKVRIDQILFLSERVMRVYLIRLIIFHFP
jgi:hypothetical protein